MAPSTLHVAAARHWVDLHYSPGDTWEIMRLLLPFIAELDARYGPGWENGDTFRAAVDAQLQEIGAL